MLDTFFSLLLDKAFLYMLDGKLGDVIETNEELTDLDDGLDEIRSVTGHVLFIW